MSSNLPPANGDLFGPDASDAPRETVHIDVGNQIDVWAWQFVNRWVFLEHQRPAALKELREWIAEGQAQGVLTNEPPASEEELHTGDDAVVDASTGVISALTDIIGELEGIQRAACIAALDLAQGALDDMRIVDAAVVATAKARLRAETGR